MFDAINPFLDVGGACSINNPERRHLLYGARCPRTGAISLHPSPGQIPASMPATPFPPWEICRPPRAAPTPRLPAFPTQEQHRGSTAITLGAISGRQALPCQWRRRDLDPRILTSESTCLTSVPDWLSHELPFRIWRHYPVPHTLH